MFSTNASVVNKKQHNQQELPESVVLWTPMDCCMGATLTESGLLQRSLTEVELTTAVSTLIGGDNNNNKSTTIELRAGNGNDESSSLSSHNNNNTSTNPGSIGSDMMVPLTIDGNVDTTTATEASSPSIKKREARYIHMSNVFSITVETFYFKSPKIILSTAMGEITFAFFKGQPFTNGTTTNPVKLRDEIYTNLMNSYNQKQWDIDDTMERQRIVQRKMITNTKVGVDAILSSAQQRHDHAKRITDRAFTTTSVNNQHAQNNKKYSSSSSSSDLDMFLTEATELVGVIQKYVATLDRSMSSNANDDDTDKLVGMLQDMGMTSILNKNTNNTNKRKKTNTSSNDDIYYDTIARQVVDLIRPKLQRQSVPMITLTDVYCLYNRSRGTQLISPEDLLYAMGRLEYLHLNLSMMTFPTSGLKVVQDPSRTNVKTLTKTFLQMCQQNGYITALSVSQQCHIPTLLAYEQLQMVEQYIEDDDSDHNFGGCTRNNLVRDETLEVIRFYPNLYF